MGSKIIIEKYPRIKVVYVPCSQVVTFPAFHLVVMCLNTAHGSSFFIRFKLSLIPPRIIPLLKTIVVGISLVVVGLQADYLTYTFLPVVSSNFFFV